MFGIAVASMGSLSPEEKERYQAIYCGLCLELKRRYGQVSRACLSYDLSFLAMLYMSLYEPVEETGTMSCPMHPRKRMTYAVADCTAYCADLSVALAYHKCLDDIADEGTRKAKVARAALASSYVRAEERIPEQCAIIAEAMDALRSMELSAASASDPAASADASARAFGDLMGFLIESCPSTPFDIWSKALQGFGYDLGRFVLLMDAAVDFEEDARTGAYNPFVLMAAQEGEASPDPIMMRDALTVIAGQMADRFERMPLVQDAHILRSVLYAGIWQKFNEEYEGRDPRIVRVGSHEH